MAAFISGRGSLACTPLSCCPFFFRLRGIRFELCFWVGFVSNVRPPFVTGVFWLFPGQFGQRKNLLDGDGVVAGGAVSQEEKQELSGRRVAGAFTMQVHSDLPLLSLFYLEERVEGCLNSHPATISSH